MQVELSTVRHLTERWMDQFWMKVVKISGHRKVVLATLLYCFEVGLATDCADGISVKEVTKHRPDAKHNPYKVQVNPIEPCQLSLFDRSARMERGETAKTAII